MQAHTSYRTYWIAWIILLALTLVMLLIEAFRLPAALTVLVLVGAMLVKAVLIGGWFMHLRYERLALVLSVVIGTLATAAALFVLLVPDGLAIRDLTPR
jgi:caa(3)-type oxidase subunit IV